jgi:Trk K+ transport system NAD-binding subunit
VDRPVLLLGLGRIGWGILEHLRQLDRPVVVIDRDCEPADPRLAGTRLVRGDFQREDVLRKAGVERAGSVLIVTSDDLANFKAALLVRQLRPDVRIVARMFNQTLRSGLGRVISNLVALSVSGLAAPLLAQAARSDDVIGSFQRDGVPQQVAEVPVRPGSHLVGLALPALEERFGVRVLAHRPAGGEFRLLHEPATGDKAPPVGPGDELVVCGPPGALPDLLSEGASGGLPELLWAGKLRRYGRVAWHTLAEADTGLVASVLVVAAVLLAGSLVLGFYQTVKVIFSNLPPDEVTNTSEGLRTFVGSLRIFGTVLIAALTAFFTNYLLRLRLSGAMEARRIPESGHFVVCGLSNLGFRIVEELVACGERVVVIEPREDNRFVTACRRMGVPVVAGDAALVQALKQARAGSARAVVTATGKELRNVEIALQVRGLNPEQRVVVPVFDPALAEGLRQASRIRRSLLVPALTAPAYVTALSVDRVLSVFPLAGRLVAVVDLHVEAGDARLEGRAAHDLARECPLLVLDAPGRLTLQAGDRVTAVAAIPDLERFLHGRGENGWSEFARFPP